MRRRVSERDAATYEATERAARVEQEKRILEERLSSGKVEAETWVGRLQWEKQILERKLDQATRSTMESTARLAHVEQKYALQGEQLEGERKRVSERDAATLEATERVAKLEQEKQALEVRLESEARRSRESSVQQQADAEARARVLEEENRSLTAKLTAAARRNKESSVQISREQKRNFLLKPLSTQTSSIPYKQSNVPATSRHTLLYSPGRESILLSSSTCPGIKKLTPKAITPNENHKRAADGPALFRASHRRRRQHTPATSAV